MIRSPTWSIVYVPPGCSRGTIDVIFVNEHIDNYAPAHIKHKKKQMDGIKQRYEKSVLMSEHILGKYYFVFNKIAISGTISSTLQEEQYSGLLFMMIFLFITAKIENMGYSCDKRNMVLSTVLMHFLDSTKRMRFRRTK